MKLSFFKQLAGLIIIIITLFGGACKKPLRILCIATNPVEFGSITYTSVTLEGEIIDIGENQVKDHGFYFSSSDFPDPAVSICHSLSQVRSPGIFNINIENLIANTNYSFKAYAVSGNDTVYGEVRRFKTLQHTTPVIVTKEISNITESSASTGGIITSDGGYDITEKGICWSTSPNPDLTDSYVFNESINDNFICELNSLSPDTKHFIRAYLKYEDKTEYGQQIILKTYSGTVTDIDGNTYYTVNIGNQKWMAENLKSGHYANGDPVPLLTSNTDWEETSSGAYCYYNNNTANADTYGAIYNAFTVLDGRSLCPSGWHIPFDYEWSILELHLGINENELLDLERGTNEGGELKEAGTIHWNEPNTGANNGSGFTALAAGVRGADGLYEEIGEVGVWYTSTADPGGGAFVRHLSYNRSTIFRWIGVDNYGTSIRCIEDSPIPTVITLQVSSITNNSVLCSGRIINNGDSETFERGFCYNTSGEPTTADNLIIDGGTGSGDFTGSLDSLSPGTTYYVRAYGTNNEGTAYGNQIEFQTEL